MEKKDYCPECKKTVIYKFSDGENKCTSCGWTKEHAEEMIMRRNILLKRKKRKKLLKWFFLFMPCILLFIYAPNRFYDALARSSGYWLLVLIPLIISSVYKIVKKMINKKK